MRNKMFACVVGCGLALASAESFAAQQEQPKMPYWQDLQTVSVNREAPRTSFMTYDDREAALSGKYENSRFYRLLNGTWKFLYSDSHRRLPADVTSRCRATGKYRDMAWPSIPTSGLSSRPATLSRRCCPTIFRWVSTGAR